MRRRKRRRCSRFRHDLHESVWFTSKRRRGSYTKRYDKIILSGGLGNGYTLVRDDVASDKKGSHRNWLVETVLYRERKHLS